MGKCSVFSQTLFVKVYAPVTCVASYSLLAAPGDRVTFIALTFKEF